MTTAKIGSNFAKHFAKNEILVPHLNNWFANAKFPDSIPIEIHMNKEEDNAFHPSSALVCSRVLFARFREDLPKPPVRPEAQKIFMFGHFSHAVLQWAVVEGLGFCSWDEIEKEYDFGWDKEKDDFDGSLKTSNDNPYRIRGFIDIARCVVPNRGTYLVDIKTMNARVYAQTDIPETTMEKYTAQVQLYLEFEDLDEAIIVCAEKDTPHRFREILIPRNPGFVDETVDRWEGVVDALAEGRVPQCTCDRPDMCEARGLYAFNFV